MYIAWQQLPVKGRGGGPFLDGPPGYAPPWRGLRCDHHGGGRDEWTPYVVEDERRDGMVRQRLVFQLPPIRSCCIQDEFTRAAWWHDVDWAIRLWAELDAGPRAADRVNDRAGIAADLRAVIRKPSPAGIRDFTAFRAAREGEDHARDEANRIYWTRQVEQEREHGQGQGHRQKKGGGRGAEPPPADCFAVLGLKPDATLARVKARHRALAMSHHPDRGGDPARFREVQDAYERALADIERRTSGR